MIFEKHIGNEELLWGQSLWKSAPFPADVGLATSVVPGCQGGSQLHNFSSKVPPLEVQFYGLISGSSQMSPGPLTRISWAGAVCNPVIQPKGLPLGSTILTDGRMTGPCGKPQATWGSGRPYARGDKSPTGKSRVEKEWGANGAGVQVCPVLGSSRRALQ